MTARLLLAVAAFRRRNPYPRRWAVMLAQFGTTLCLANALLILAGSGNEWIVSLCVLGAVCDSVAFLLWVGEG